MKNICPKTDRNFIFSEVAVAYSENSDGMVDSWSVIPKQEDYIPYIPASVFDTDSVLKSGNADLLMKHPFSVDSDLDSIDRADDYLRHSVQSGFRSVQQKVIDSLPKD